MFRIKNKTLLYIFIGASILLLVLYSPIGSPYYYSHNEPIPVSSMNFNKGIPNLPKHQSINAGSEIILPQISETGNNITPNQANRTRLVKVDYKNTPISNVNAHQKKILATNSKVSESSSTFSQGIRNNSVGTNRRNSSDGGIGVKSTNFGSINISFNNKKGKNQNISSNNELKPLFEEAISTTSLNDGPLKGPGGPPIPGPIIPIPNGILTLIAFLVLYGFVLRYRIKKQAN